MHFAYVHIYLYMSHYVSLSVSCVGILMCASIYVCMCVHIHVDYELL